jgi:Icc protein
MSRRSFLRWLLVAAASLIGLSAGFAKWLSKHVFVEKETAQAATAIPSSQPTELASGDISTVQTAALGEPLLSYFVFSDLHISSYDSATSIKLKQALDDVKSFDSKVEAIFMTGDLTDTGTAQDFKELRTILDSYKLPPYYANMGNHDYYSVWINKTNGWDKDTFPNGKSDALSREQFNKFFGYKKPYNEVTLNGYTFLLLSQETYVQEKPEVGEGAWYSDEQLKWLTQRLAASYDPVKPMFVMIHQPLPAIGDDGGTHQLIRAKEFRRILKPYKNVFVLCGHRHMDFQNGTPHYVQETFHFFHNSSVGRPLNRNYQAETKTKSQGYYVQVYTNKIVFRGREFSNRTFLQEAEWTIDLQPAKD